MDPFDRYATPPWPSDALCTQVGNPDLWYPDKGGPTRDAKKVCAGCPIREQCLAYALEHRERYGIWGGTTERERRAMWREEMAA